jgi:hypothetical protein
LEGLLLLLCWLWPHLLDFFVQVINNEAAEAASSSGGTGFKVI